MIKYTKMITFNTVYGGNMNIKKGLSIFISAVMVFSPITSVRAYDADDDKAVIESPAVSDNDISEDKAVITHEAPKVKASSGTCGDDLTWTLDSRTLTISGTGDMTNYSSSSNAPWYNNRSDVITLIIDDSVTSIGDYAFYDCTNLKSVMIPESVTSMGDSAFEKCSNIENLYITDLAKWCGINFYDVDSNPLSGAAELYVDGEVLTNLVIPDGITSIADFAFSAYSGLESVTIPESVTSIGNNAFFVCPNLEKVYITDIAKWCGISFYSIYSNPLIYGAKLYLNGEVLTNLVIPGSVTSISNYAFGGCSSITAVTISDGVTSISDHAFYNCSNLTSVTIPDGVTSISDYTFSRCESLASVTIPDSVTSIGNYAFEFCSSLATITIPDSVTRIGNYAFDFCSSLATITIPDSVTRIGYNAFEFCSSLAMITIPDSVIMIGYDAFSLCDNLESVYIASIESWSNILFDSWEANPLYYAEKLYLNGELVTNLVLPEGITTVKSYVFNNVKCIKSLVIPEGVLRIQSDAFRDCSEIETVTLPKSLVNINENAFSQCHAIKKVYYAGSEAEWNNILINSGNDNLKNAEIVYGVIADDDGESGDNSHGSYLAMGTLGTSQWVLFEDGTAIINGTGAPEFTDIPFYKHRDTVTSVKISDGITSIPEDMFYKCEKITKVIIPKSVKSIGDSAFWRCSDITEVYYGGTAEEWNNITIGEYNDALLGASFTYSYSAVTEVGIKFLANPPKKVYSYGEELALDNTVVVKKFSDGSFTEIEDYTVTGYDKYTFGRQEVSITYGGYTIDLVVAIKPTEAKTLTAPITAGMTVGEFSAQYSELYTVFVLDNDKETLLSKDDVMRSGSVVQFVSGDVAVDSAVVNVLGDATGDGVVNGKDLIRIKKQILEGSAVEYTEFADVNCDGVVDENDLDALVNML